ncbi:LTA synthase family protein [Halomonas mongoliensis]|uniref:LTA synthase family protein n=1 Tax=Halomonas mongoliensis TaxID=321265 RepID=UPI00403B24B6
MAWLWGETLISALLAWLTGGVASFLLEGLIRPRLLPPWRRPAAALLIHLGSWCLLYAAFLLLVQRPWFAMAFILCLQLVLIQSNHVKWKTLKEPFLFQDFDYFLDAIRHPRLYLPFFGIGLAIGASLAGAAAIALLFWLEPWLVAQAGPWTYLAGLATLVLIGGALLMAGLARLPAVSLKPAVDLPALGLYAFLWSYARQAKRPIDARLSPQAFRQQSLPPSRDRLPDVVVIQSESFFDPRRWLQVDQCPELIHWDRACGTGLHHGGLVVPAWGANTARTEAAFLTGLPNDLLGIHRFSPYRQLARQALPNLVSQLKRWGYHTVAIHPYPADFYLRHQVFPKLGFDQFIDIKSFDEKRDRDGQYISDAAVAQQICHLLGLQHNKPLFIFAITMENHGPLALEAAQRPEGAGGTHPELATYLRHLENADQMLGQLMGSLEAQDRPGLLCWYGDHVPIMDRVYRQLGEPDGTTDYVIWSPRHDLGASAIHQNLKAEALGEVLLNHIINASRPVPKDSVATGGIDV